MTNEEIVAKLLGTPLPEKKIDEELKQAIEENKVAMENVKVGERVMVIGNILDTKQAGLFPTEPVEGIRINMIRHGQWKGKGFNASYSRPGEPVRSGNNEQFFPPKDTMTELGGMKIAYDRALEKMTKLREIDIAARGPVRDEEREAERRLRKTKSRAERDARYLRTVVSRLQAMSFEEKLKQCEIVGIEREENEASLTCSLIMKALEIVFGKESL